LNFRVNLYIKSVQVISLMCQEMAGQVSFHVCSTPKMYMEEGTVSNRCIPCI